MAPAPADAAGQAALASQPLSWNGCVGASVGLAGLSRHYPSSAPQGWEPDAASGASLRVLVLRCERVAWDGFERGPVFMLQEWRDDFRAPRSCWAGDHDVRYLLESIWFSDEGLARHAAGLGLPAHAARFAVQRATMASVPVDEWSWDVGGGATATVALPAPGDGGADFTGLRQPRLFWADGDGVSSLDVRYNVTTADPGLPLAWGSLPAPMLHGRAGPSPAFAAASAARLFAVDGVADLHRYRDRACEQPL